MIPLEFIFAIWGFLMGFLAALILVKLEIIVKDEV